MTHRGVLIGLTVAIAAALGFLFYGFLVDSMKFDLLLMAVGILVCIFIAAGLGFIETYMRARFLEAFGEKVSTKAYRRKPYQARICEYLMIGEALMQEALKAEKGLLESAFEDGATFEAKLAAIRRAFRERENNFRRAYQVARYYGF